MSRGKPKQSRAERRARQRERDDATELVQELACPTSVARMLLTSIDDHLDEVDVAREKVHRVSRVWRGDASQPALAEAIEALLEETSRHADALERITERLFAVSRHVDHEDLTWDEVIARLR